MTARKSLVEALRFAYADPPYPGQSARHYSDHPDYAGEVDHAELATTLLMYDGWVLHTSSPALYDVETQLRAAGHEGYRVMPWVKPFAAFKRNVPVAYAWEPVIVQPVRKPIVKEGDGLHVPRLARGVDHAPARPDRSEAGEARPLVARDGRGRADRLLRRPVPRKRSGHAGMGVVARAAQCEAGNRRMSDHRTLTEPVSSLEDARRLTLGEELFVVACLEIGMTYDAALVALKARKA